MSGKVSGVIGAFPNNYAFKAYKTSTQNIPENNTDLVVFEGLIGYWDGSAGFDLSSNYYITPSTGTYHIGCAGRFQDAASEGANYGWKMNITKNQTVTADSQVTVTNQGPGTVSEEEAQYISSNSVSGIMSLVAGDILRLYAGGFMGDDRLLLASSDGAYQTYMYGYKISRDHLSS